MALKNAELALAQHLGAKTNALERASALGEALGLDDAPARVECFDISHTMGRQLSPRVWFWARGAIKSDYRRFNIKGVKPGDDYGAMREALRRYTRLKREEASLPDVVLMDGGKGQLSEATRY